MFFSVKSDALFSYQPPFNILAFILLKPASWVLTPRALHTFNVFLIKITSLPQLIVIGTYGALSLFFNVQPYGRLLYGLIGATWSFHFTFTCWMIPKKQTDLTDQGTFFSLVVIYLMNLLLLSVMLVLASSQITFADLGADFVVNGDKFVHWLSSF